MPKQMNQNLNVQKNAPKKKSKFHYSLLTIVLIVCIIELANSAFQNISKNLHYSSKIKGLENKKAEELSKNKQLKSEINNFNSDAIFESIARNNLKMAGKDEILLIINKPKEEVSDNTKKKKDN